MRCCKKLPGLLLIALGAGMLLSVILGGGFWAVLLGAVSVAAGILLVKKGGQ